ncbi:hypothetical protein SLA2020_020960 [Shorea laevis]
MTLTTWRFSTFDLLKGLVAHKQQHQGLLVCVRIIQTETERLKIAEEYGIVDTNATVPMGVLVSAVCVDGCCRCFPRVGLQEFFYEQVGKDTKSVGLALCPSVFGQFGVGNFLSSFLVSIVKKASGWCLVT